MWIGRLVIAAAFRMSPSETADITQTGETHIERVE